MPFKRILLVKPSGRRGLSFGLDLIPIGLEYIAAYVAKSCEEIHIVDMEKERRGFKDIVETYSPDLIGVTCSATEHNEALLLANIAKKKEVTTVVGGYHPTSIPDWMLSNPQIDVVVRGEGEHTMLDLIKNGSPEDVLGTSYKREGKIIHNEDRPAIKDLDSIPFPARHLRQYTYKSKNRTKDCDVLVMSRGCSGVCSFCCEPSMSQGCSRCRSPENVMKEILEVFEYHKRTPLSILFADPNFMGYPGKVDHLCDLLMENRLDIEFGAMVRADAMARNPEIVKKMCNAGITSFEMGIESPNLRDLKSTKKGITNGIHREAVQNIREHGGRAGGTFVIGLPNQTEEEIKTFPIYAKEIGLTGAAFGIATPFPGTEFYGELDKQGLIFETNWDNFDEMHSVFKNKNMSKEELEELATYCMAKFWNIDTFIDQEAVFQKRTKKKKAIIDFVLERKTDVEFMKNNGNTLQNSNFTKHIKTFIDAYVDSRVESYTKEVKLNDVLEMKRFLNILGPQKIQCNLSIENINASFVFKTNEKDVEYIQATHERQDDATIDLNVNLEWLSKPELIHSTEKFSFLVSNNLNRKRLWNTIKLFTAVGMEVLAWKLSEIKRARRSLAS